MDADGRQILVLKGVTKRYLSSSSKALDQVDVAVEKGEVRALVGENGAGKSTLVKIIAGAVHPDEGQIFLDGHLTKLTTPKSAIDAGISVIYQELDLVPYLNATQNIFLGSELRRRVVKVLDRRRMEAEAEELVKRFHIDIDVTRPLRDLTIAEQQMVAIVKSVAQKARIILMDEPSSSLSGRELEDLFEFVRRLKAHGVTIVYISHRLEEIFSICDSVTVLRDGKHVVTSPIGQLTKEIIVEKMIGKQLEWRDGRPKAQEREIQESSPILELKNVSCGKVLTNITISLHRGQTIGVLGLFGSGRLELAKILFGVRSATEGQIVSHGQTVRLHNPFDALKNSISYIPENRRAQGLFFNLPILENAVCMALRDRKNWLGMINKRRLLEEFLGYRSKLNIKIGRPADLVGSLSGGNQQKVLIARCLIKDTDVIVLNEPTRGVDVGAKIEIYRILAEIAGSGKGILLFSSEIPELVKTCDQIVVLKRGKMHHVFEKIDFDENEILRTLLS